jgi:hypothetical protein
MIGNRFRLAPVLVCCLVAASFCAPASLAQSDEEQRTTTRERQARPPGKLWERFPLGEPARQRASPTAVRPSSQPRPVPIAFESEGDELGGGELVRLVLLLVGLAALVLLGPAVFMLVRPRPPAKADVAVAASPVFATPPAFVALQRERLLGAMRRPGTIQARVLTARAVAMEALEWNSVSFDAEGRQELVEEKIVRPVADGGDRGDPAVRDEPVQQEPTHRDYAQFGDRVASVLRAAEEAAEQIRADARAAAQGMTRQAEQEAKARLEQSRGEADRLRAEADAESRNTRESAQAYTANHRREAEEHAARLLSEAETQARTSREAAEAMVHRIEESARALEEEVREQERMIRGRMQRYLAGLKDVSTQIEAVLGETERDAPPLVEALNVERAGQRDS